MSEKNKKDPLENLKKLWENNVIHDVARKLNDHKLLELFEALLGKVNKIIKESHTTKELIEKSDSVISFIKNLRSLKDIGDEIKITCEEILKKLGEAESLGIYDEVLQELEKRFKELKEDISKIDTHISTIERVKTFLNDVLRELQNHIENYKAGIKSELIRIPEDIIGQVNSNLQAGGVDSVFRALKLIDQNWDKFEEANKGKKVILEEFKKLMDDILSKESLVQNEWVRDYLDHIVKLRLASLSIDALERLKERLKKAEILNEIVTEKIVDIVLVAAGTRIAKLLLGKIAEIRREPTKPDKILKITVIDNIELGAYSANVSCNIKYGNSTRNISVQVSGPTLIFKEKGSAKVLNILNELCKYINEKLGGNIGAIGRIEGYGKSSSVDSFCNEKMPTFLRYYDDCIRKLNQIASTIERTFPNINISVIINKINEKISNISDNYNIGEINIKRNI